MEKKLILLVENNKKVQKFNKRMLERDDFAVETAMTLADARSFLARQNPNAIILDISMPDGSGLDFLRELRQTSKIPVLLLSGYRMDSNFNIEAACDCDGYLAKPYEFGVLLDRLKLLLKKAK